MPRGLTGGAVDETVRPMRNAAALLLLCLSACREGVPAAGTTPAGELVVFASSSLREVMEALADRFEARNPGVDVRLHLAGSHELRAQIEHGARADVIATANPDHMAALAAQGLVRQVRNDFACNALVLIVPADNPAGIGGFADLHKARRLVLGVPGVPAGAFADAVLQKARETHGEAFVTAVRARVVSREMNVRHVLARVVLGEADAALVYATDARTAPKKVRAHPLPPALAVTAHCPIAAVTDARQPDLALRFLQLAQGPEAKAILDEAGFLPCPGAAPETAR